MMFIANLVSLTLKNRLLLIKVAWVMYGILVSLLVLSYFIPSLQNYWSEWGRKAADLAVICFVLSLLPGIMKRYQMGKTLAQLQLILMTFRRQTGMGMFWLVLAHYCWSRGFGLIKTHASLIPSQKYEIIGMIAFLITIPLFLTSNNVSIQKMGSGWKKLHKLVYGLNWLVFTHVALLGQAETITALIFLTAIAEIISWTMVKYKGEIEL